MSKHSAHTAAISAAADRRWAEFERLVALGMNFTQACREIGVTKSAYDQRRSRDRDFAARIDTLVSRRRQAVEEPWTGSSADWAMKYIPPPDDAGLDWPNEPYHYSPYQHHVTRALDSLDEGEILLVTLPPGARKTTTIENWILKTWCEDNRQARIGYISHSRDFSAKSSLRLKRILADDPELAPELHAKYGPFRGHGSEKRSMPWGSYAWSILGGPTGSRDYSFAAMGATGHIYGSRFEVIVLDDYQTEKNLTATEELLHRFRTVILSRRPRAGRGKVAAVMTHLEVGDFVDRLVEENLPGFRHIDLPVMTPDGKTRDPDCFPQDELETIRAQVGQRGWAAMYMGKPQLVGNSTFTETMVTQAQDRSLGIGWTQKNADGQMVSVQRPATWNVVVGLDPNLGDGITSLTAAGFNAKKFRVLDIDELQGVSRTEEFLDHLEAYAQKYRPDRVRIEANNFQKGLARDERLLALAKTYGFRVLEHTTSGASKEDAVVGVARMPTSFNAGEFIIPYGDELARTKMDVFCLELRTWRPRVSGAKLKQDSVMSTWFCWLDWMEMRPREPVKLDGWRTRGLHAPTSYRPLTGTRR